MIGFDYARLQQLITVAIADGIRQGVEMALPLIEEAKAKSLKEQHNRQLNFLYEASRVGEDEPS